VSSGHEHPGNAVGSAAAVTAAWTPPSPDSGAGAASAGEPRARVSVTAVNAPTAIIACPFRVANRMEGRADSPENVMQVTPLSPPEYATLAVGLGYPTCY